MSARYTLLKNQPGPAANPREAGFEYFKNPLLWGNLVGTLYYIAITAMAIVEWSFARVMTIRRWGWVVNGMLIQTVLFDLAALMCRGSGYLRFDNKYLNPWMMVSHAVVHLVTSVTLVILMWLFIKYWEGQGDVLFLFDHMRWNVNPPIGLPPIMQTQWMCFMTSIIVNVGFHIQYFLQSRFGGLAAIWQYISHERFGGARTISREHDIEGGSKDM